MTMWSDRAGRDRRAGAARPLPYDARETPGGDGPGVNKALLVGAGILMSRLAGLVRLRAFAHYFGLRSDAADAFNAAFRIPNVLQNLFGEGALSGSFIPVYAGLLAHGDREEAHRVASAVGALLALVVAILVTLGVVATPVAHRGHRARLHRRQARADRQHGSHPVSRHGIAGAVSLVSRASSTATRNSCCRTPRRSCGTPR